MTNLNRFILFLLISGIAVMACTTLINVADDISVTIGIFLALLYLYYAIYTIQQFIRAGIAAWKAANERNPSK